MLVPKLVIGMATTSALGLVPMKDSELDSVKDSVLVTMLVIALALLTASSSDPTMDSMLDSTLVTRWGIWLGKIRVLELVPALD